MKKIVALITSLVLCFSLCCIPSYAASSTVNFDDYFLPTNIIIAPLNEDTHDVEKRYYTDTHIYEAIPARDDEVLYYWGAHVRVKFIPEGVSAGTRLIFDMKVDIFMDDRVINTEYVYPKLMVNDNGKWKKAGTWKALNNWTSADKTLTMLYKVDYLFTEDVSEVMFTFDQPSVDQTLVPFYRVEYHFPEKVTNFYFGSNDDPSLPNYVDPNDTIGGSVDDYKEQEEAIMGETEEGRESTISLFSGLGDLVDLVATPIMAISAAVSYFIDGSIVNSILLISLTLGLLSFVFNIVPSYQAKQRRDAAEERRRQYQQYKKGGGG